MLQKNLWIKLLEGKENPTEVPDSESKFEREFGSKIAALLVIMMEPLCGSRRAVMMDSDFGYMT